ncbi:MAG: hypothetical protein ACOZAR_01320 [Patescibacteria group bacterium]
MKLAESESKIETLPRKLIDFEDFHKVDAAVICIGNPELWSHNIRYAKSSLSEPRIDHYNFIKQSKTEDQIELVEKVDLASIGLHHSNKIILIGDGQGEYKEILNRFTDLSKKYLLEQNREITIQTVIQKIQKNEIHYYDCLGTNCDIVSLNQNIDEIKPQAIFVCCIDPRFIMQTIDYIEEIKRKNYISNSVLLTYPGSILCGLKDKSHYLNRYIKEIVEGHNVEQLFFINHEACGGYREITKLHGWLQVLQQQKDLNDMEKYYLQELLPAQKNLRIEKIQMKIDSLDKATNKGKLYFEIVK